jgi:GNAT superfamily N-acetyltransferase
MHVTTGKPIAEIIEDNTAEFFLGLGRAGGCEVCDGPDIRYVFSGHGFNRVMHDRFPAGSADEVVTRVVSRLDGLGIDALWFVTPLSAPELPVFLMRHGFSYNSGWKSMAMDLSSFSPGPAAPRGLEIREVSGREDADTWARIVVEGFEIDDDVHRDYGRHLIAGYETGSVPRHHYLGLLDGRPVATALFFEGSEAAGLYWISTLPDARGGGIASAMVRHALREAQAAGYRHAILNASEAGHPMYLKLGFDDCFATAIYRRPASPHR